MEKDPVQNPVNREKRTQNIPRAQPYHTLSS